MQFELSRKQKIQNALIYLTVAIIPIGLALLIYFVFVATNIETFKSSFVRDYHSELGITAPDQNEETPTFSDPGALTSAYCDDQKISCETKELYDGVVINGEGLKYPEWHGKIIELENGDWIVSWERATDEWVLSAIFSDGCETYTDQPSVVDFCNL